MKQSMLDVTTYAIEVNPSTTGQGPGWSKLLRSMAEGVGGGKYMAVNSSADGGAQISTAVNKALSEVQAVNSVFASVSLPVSANTQGTYSNQVYIGMFRPDSGAYPRWTGNLKQYRLGYVNSALRLVDADAQGAVNGLTGFITECARSFWTPSIDATDDYWAFRPAGECIPPTGSAATWGRVRDDAGRRPGTAGDRVPAVRRDHPLMVGLRDFDELRLVLWPAIDERARVAVDDRIDVFTGDRLVGLERMRDGEHLEAVLLEQSRRLLE